MQKIRHTSFEIYRIFENCPLEWRSKDRLNPSAEPGYSPMAKIPTLAVGSRAAAALRGETEPKFCPMGKTLGSHPVRGEKQKGHHKGVLFVFGSGTRIRTQTYRVRVCCATFTQFR